MAPMKSSREMAVAARSGNAGTKRFASDDESDSDDSMSASDYSNPKAGKGRNTGSNKKPRNSTSSKSSSANNPTRPTTNSLADNVPLPPQMACPEGVKAWTKPHWNAILKTDEFWDYFNKFVTPALLKKRLAITINVGLNAEILDSREKKEAAKNRVLKPSATKGGPINLPFDAREGSVASASHTGDRNGEEMTNSAAGLSQAGDGEDRKQESVGKAEVKGSTGEVGLTPEFIEERMKEHRMLLAQAEAIKAAREVKAAAVSTTDEVGGVLPDSTTVTDQPATSPPEIEDSTSSSPTKGNTGEEDEKNGNGELGSTTSPPVVPDTNGVEKDDADTEPQGWKPKGW